VRGRLVGRSGLLPHGRGSLGLLAGGGVVSLRTAAAGGRLGAGGVVGGTGVPAKHSSTQYQYKSFFYKKDHIVVRKKLKAKSF
jgi:hypothetical protein